MAKKKQNFIAAYFSHFGLRQICDILMLVGGIILIVGLCTTDLVAAVGLGFYIAAAALAIIRSVRVLLSGINKRSPEFKSSVINLVIMSLIFALAVFGFVWAIIS